MSTQPQAPRQAPDWIFVITTVLGILGFLALLPAIVYMTFGTMNYFGATSPMVDSMWTLVQLHYQLWVWIPAIVGIVLLGASAYILQFTGR